ncbi:MAG: YigZ family protein [Calditrichaceae bacterium]
MSTDNLSSDEYLVPAKTADAEIKVKGSRFIATVFHAETKESAEEQYLLLKKKNYNATHNCFAYRIDDNLFRYSDDGEPSGTAGKPILQTIDGQNIYEVLCVVTRYFGGTKLGTGGLIRAYSDAAAEALKQLRLKVKVRAEIIRLGLHYEQENIIRNLLNEFNGKIVGSDYTDQIKMDVSIPESLRRNFEERLTEITHSTVTVTSL